MPQLLSMCNDTVYSRVPSNLVSLTRGELQFFFTLNYPLNSWKKMFMVFYVVSFAAAFRLVTQRSMKEIVLYGTTLLSLNNTKSKTFCNSSI